MEIRHGQIVAFPRAQMQKYFYGNLSAQNRNPENFFLLASDNRHRRASSTCPNAYELSHNTISLKKKVIVQRLKSASSCRGNKSYRDQISELGDHAPLN